MSGPLFRPVSVDFVVATGEPATMFVFTPEKLREPYDASVFDVALQWCVENLPTLGENVEKRWMTGSGFRIIYIRDKTDAAAFKLRWC